MGKRLLAQVQGHSGLSGFYLLTSGMDAFLCRALMIDAARSSIDLQYYIVEDGTTTRLLFDRLIRAADRGVRVRMLIDDIHAEGLGLATLNAHPNIQVRAFNPFRSRYLGSLSRPLVFLLHPAQADRRMHNKMIAVDGAAAIVGGRNLADGYFGANPATFMDLDLWVVGPIVDQVERSFEDYWNSDWSWSIGWLHIFSASTRDVDKLRQKLEQEAHAAERTAYAAGLRNTDLLRRLQNGELHLIWAPAELSYDRPGKVAGRPGADHVGPDVRALASETRCEAIYISPYFIPGTSGMDVISDLRRRHVRVAVLTGSLLATDIVPAYAAFSRYREPLLRMGAEIYELKPSAEFRKSVARRLFGSSSRSTLHAKAYLFDREVVLIGSFNLDPRSRHLNTELGLIVHSSELARQVYALFQEATQPGNSYHVQLLPPIEAEQQHSTMVWETADQGGREIRLDQEPGQGALYYLSEIMLKLFPLEGLL